MENYQRNIIAQSTPDDFQPGRMGQFFHDGALAIQLHDDRITELWAELVLTQKDTGKAFWQRGLADFSRNHVSTQMDVGDLFRFCPGLYGHIARKAVLYQDSGSREIKIIPEYFWCDGQREAWSQDTKRLAWDLAADIFKGVLPASFQYPNYGVGIELLKYPSCLTELEDMFNLLADSSGGWARVGQQMDTYKAMAEGPLNTKVLRDLFALGSLIPGLRYPLHLLNRSLRPLSRYQNPTDRHLIGPPHTDTARTITCIGGDRDRITTEVYDGREWHELGFTPDSLFIFPASTFSKELNFVPTVHRYSTTHDRSRSDAESPNVTLMLSLVNKEPFIKIADQFR